MKIKRKNIAKLSDREMYEAWAAGSGDVFAGALMLRYLPWLYGLFLRHTGVDEEAAAMVEGFDSSLSGLLSGFDNQCDLQEWLYAQASEFAGHPVVENDGFDARHRAIVHAFATGDPEVAETFAEKKTELKKPQRECVEAFLIRRETFGRIAAKSGYLVDKVCDYIEEGIVGVWPAGDPVAAAKGAHAFDPDALRDKYMTYIKGQHDGDGAYEVELAAMLDPFVSDAVLGAISVAGDHARIIADLDRRLALRYFGKPRKAAGWVAIGLVVAAIAATVAFVMLTDDGQPQQQLPAQDEQPAQKPHGERGSTPEGGQDATPADETALPAEGADGSPEQGVNNRDVRDDNTVEGVGNTAEGRHDANGSAAGRQGMDTARDSDTVTKIPDADAAQDNDTMGKIADTDAARDNDAPKTNAAPTGTNTAANHGKITASVIFISEADEDTDATPGYVSRPTIGLKKYNEYLRKISLTPDDGVTGDVTLTFIVNKYGRPSRIRVTDFLSKEAHAEAIRLLEHGPEWTATEEPVTVVLRFE